MSDNNWDIDHVLDPETEDLIYGSELQEGMVVLVEERSSFRNLADLDRDENFPGEHNLLISRFDESVVPRHQVATGPALGER